MAIKTRSGALSAARKLYGRKAEISHQPYREIPERKLKNGRIKKARTIEESFSVGYQMIMGGIFGMFVVCGEGKSWDEAIQKAKEDKKRTAEHEAKRKKRNAARS